MPQQLICIIMYTVGHYCPYFAISNTHAKITIIISSLSNSISSALASIQTKHQVTSFKQSIKNQRRDSPFRVILPPPLHCCQNHCSISVCENKIIVAFLSVKIRLLLVCYHHWQIWQNYSDLYFHRNEVGSGLQLSVVRNVNELYSRIKYAFVDKCTTTHTLSSFCILTAKYTITAWYRMLL